MALTESDKKLSIATQIFGLEQQLTVFSNLCISLTSELDLSVEQKRRLVLSLGQNGKGLMKKGKTISSSHYCDDHLREWVNDVCAKIEMYYLLLLEEYLEGEGCSETEEELVKEIDEHIVDYSNGVEIYSEYIK